MKKLISVMFVMVACMVTLQQNSWGADNTIRKESQLVKQSDGDLCAFVEYEDAKQLESNECSITPANDCDGKTSQAKSSGGKKFKCLRFKKDNKLHCAATECDSDKVMPIAFESKNDAKDHINGRIYGYCYTMDQAKSKCTCEDTLCSFENPEGSKCEPDIETSVQKVNKMLKQGVTQLTGGKAFVGCKCVIPSNDCGPEKCKFKGEIVYKCKGTSNVETFKGFEVDISKTATVKEAEQLVVKEAGKKADELCTGKGGATKDDITSVKIGKRTIDVSSVTINQFNTIQFKETDPKLKANLNEASENLTKFFSKIDADRSVWKNADGSFNGVRLASDLTAGVVLGTVGGVVSGVLIKKSQVEKGFDALHCTVGGQKIADWGDEFRVGLRR